MDAWRKLSLTVVNSAPRASAWVACVCRIQWGLARRSFSAVEGLCSWMTSATCMKNRLVILHSREDVMLWGPSSLWRLSVHLQSVTFALSFGTKWLAKMFDFKGDAVFPMLRCRV